MSSQFKQFHVVGRKLVRVVLAPQHAPAAPSASSSGSPPHPAQAPCLAVVCECAQLGCTAKAAYCGVHWCISGQTHHTLREARPCARTRCPLLCFAVLCSQLRRTPLLRCTACASLPRTLCRRSLVSGMWCAQGWGLQRGTAGLDGRLLVSACCWLARRCAPARCTQPAPWPA